MTDDSAEIERQKLLYRLQHIIPRSLSTSSFYNDKLQIPWSKTADGPQDVEFQMTWGKVAGSNRFKVCTVFLAITLYELLKVNCQIQYYKLTYF